MMESPKFIPSKFTSSKRIFPGLHRISSDKLEDEITCLKHLRDQKIPLTGRHF